MLSDLLKTQRAAMTTTKRDIELAKLDYDEAQMESERIRGSARQMKTELCDSKACLAILRDQVLKNEQVKFDLARETAELKEEERLAQSKTMQLQSCLEEAVKATEDIIAERTRLEAVRRQALVNLSHVQSKIELMTTVCNQQDATREKLEEQVESTSRKIDELRTSISALDALVHEGELAAHQAHEKTKQIDEGRRNSEDLLQTVQGYLDDQTTKILAATKQYNTNERVLKENTVANASLCEDITRVADVNFTRTKDMMKRKKELASCREKMDLTKKNLEGVERDLHVKTDAISRVPRSPRHLPSVDADFKRKKVAEAAEASLLIANGKLGRIQSEEAEQKRILDNLSAELADEISRNTELELELVKVEEAIQNIELRSVNASFRAERGTMETYLRSGGDLLKTIIDKVEQPDSFHSSIDSDGIVAKAHQCGLRISTTANNAFISGERATPAPRFADCVGGSDFL